MCTQINITSYRIGPWAGRLPLRLISVAVMEATQQGENKYNVATDHQAKQNKTPYPKCVRLCLGCIRSWEFKFVAQVCLSVYQSINLSIYLSICLYVRVSVCLSVRVYVCMFVCLSLCLYVCLSVCISVCLYVCMSVCMSVYLSVYLSVCYFCFCLNLYLYICINVFLFVRTCPSIKPSV